MKKNIIGVQRDNDLRRMFNAILLRKLIRNILLVTKNVYTLLTPMLDTYDEIKMGGHGRCTV
jgi:hypothetical protein